MSDDKRKGDGDLLEIRTPVLMQQLGSACQAVAIAAPEQVSFGTEVGALDQQCRYLEKYLVQIRAEDVAAYQLPAELELRTVEVDLERLDVPARLRRPIRVAVPCAIAPHGHDRWVIVPGLPHTFFVARTEDLDDAIRAEVARVVAAAEPGELDVRSLFPADDTWLEHATASLLVGVDGLAGRARAVRTKRVEAHRRAMAREVLEQAGTVLEAAALELPPLVERDRELAQLGRLLDGPARASVLVVGDEAVGKSALMRHWVATRPSSSSPVLSTSVAQLVAGASGFGEWQERLASVLEAAELLDAVLYFENLGELFGEHPERGGVDIAGGLRRHVIDERVRVAGELTAEALERARRHHVALLGAMSELRVEPLDAAATVTAVERRIAHWRAREPERAPIAAEVAQPVVDLARRYMPYRAFPGKAIRFLEELRATRETVRDAAGEPVPIRIQDCYDAFSLTSGIPGFLLREDQPLEAASLVRAFRRRMIGQDQAVDRVAETVCLVKSRLQPEGKPLATFLFVGPTGVGKTELARTVAEYLFGSADRLTRFDMSEYTDALAGDRLIRGTASSDGLLTGKVREQPFCVLLLDEIEKAHPAVHDLLLQVCGEGRLTDARGRTTFFDNAIIIMTSNLGAAHRRERLGIAAAATSDDDHYQRAARAAFRPEMINRIDRIVAFAPLTPDEVARVARLAVERIRERRGLQEAGVALEVSEAALAELARGGYSEIYGVRALRRHVDDRLVTPLAHELARLGAVARGAITWVGLAAEETPAALPVRQRLSTIDTDGLRIELFRRQAAVGRSALRGVSAAAAMRRECDGLLALDEAVDLRDQVANLRSQLVTAVQPSKRKKSARRQQALGAEMEKLRRDFHRLETTWSQVEGALADLHAAEELSITAVLDGEEAAQVADAVRDAYHQVRRAFFWVLVADRTERDVCFVRVRRIKGASPFQLWLAPMLAWADRRGWQVEVHLPGEKGAGWPAERAWGPPHEGAWLRSRLQSAPDTLDRMLLRVSGTGAGVLLPVEVGTHRFRGYSNNENGDHLDVGLVALRPELTPEEWTDAAMAEPPARTVARKVPLARERTKGDATVTVAGHHHVDLAAYDGDYFAAIEELGLETLLHARATAGIAALYVALLDVSKDEEDEA